MNIQLLLLMIGERDYEIVMLKQQIEELKNQLAAEINRGKLEPSNPS